MELTPSMMALLGDADYATRHNHIYVLKGFWSMFVPVLEGAASVVWHYLRTDDQSYLPYSAAKKYASATNLDHDCFLFRRHFVGWVSEAEILAGQYHFFTITKVLLLIMP
jgi:hypothetical protein